MNCRTNDFWRAYTDTDSLVSQRHRADAETHLKSCQSCRRLVDEIEKNKEFARASLAPGAGAPVGAWQRFAGTAIDAPGEHRQDRSRFTLAAAILGAVAVIGILGTAPVQTLAADFLGLFRAEKLAAINIDPAALLDFDPSQLGDFEITPPDQRIMRSLDEAAVFSGLKLALPTELPKGIVRGNMTAATAGKVSLTFEKDRFDDYLAENGISGIDLPAAIDGETITGHLPPWVAIEFFDTEKDDRHASLVLGQAGLPTVDGPAGIDFDSIRDELLELPFFPPSVREQLSALTDWKRTLPVPYPGDDVSVEKVRVNEAEDGLYFTSNDGETVLIWTFKEQAYGLIAPKGSRFSAADLMTTARNL